MERHSARRFDTAGGGGIAAGLESKYMNEETAGWP